MNYIIVSTIAIY